MSRADDSPCFVFAGGGSGGHISPGLAIDERLREKQPSVQTHFLCSSREIDHVMLEEAGASFTAMPALPPGRSPRAAWRFLTAYRRTIAQATAEYSSLQPARVIALGGFVAAPVVAAANRTGIPTMLLNLDRPPGKANRMIARRCDRVLTAVSLPRNPGFADAVVGMPIRRGALAPSNIEECKAELGLDPTRPLLLITGASQGATSINRMFQHLAASEGARFTGWQLLHLTGEGEAEAMQAAYERGGVAAKVIPFLHRMGLAWGAADLAISRAGANSVAEAAANSVPTIFLPYPYHRDQHQRRNAQPLMDGGGAVIVDDQIEPIANAKAIRAPLETLMRDTAARMAMRAALRHRERTDAAVIVADILLERAASRALADT